MNRVSYSSDRRARTMTDADRQVWGDAPPLLGANASGTYRGRLVAEVWFDGFVCLSMTTPALLDRARGAVSGGMPVRKVDAESPLAPLMADRPDVPFLGRVILEFWGDESPVVGVSGADESLLLGHVERRLAISF